MITEIQDKRFLYVFLITVLFVLFILIGPVFFGGGLEYTTLRGNGSDAFNYMTIAGYLQHEPLSMVKHLDSQALLDIHPTYVWAKYLLYSRWASSAMLAFCSCASAIPIDEFEYFFSLFCFFVAIGPLFAICRVSSISPRDSMLLVCSTLLGFWASFVLDIRAVSQITSIPVILLFLYGILELDYKILRPSQSSGTNFTFLNLSVLWKSPSWPLKEILLCSIILAALLFLYVEIIPMVLLGMGFFLLWQLVYKRYIPKELIKYFVLVVVAFLLVTPTGKFLFDFFRSQIALANSGQLSTWHIAFFGWLYKHPVTGFWGLTYLSEGFNTFGLVPVVILKILALSLGAVCTVIFSAAWIVPLMKRKEITESAVLVSLVNSFLCACLLQFFYFLVKKEYWIAGKGLSFGFYLIPLCVFAFCLNQTDIGIINRFLPVAKKVLMVWMFIQLFIGLSRTTMAVYKTDYTFIKNLHDNYRRHDWNLRDFRTKLSHQMGSKIWFYVTNDWAAWYLDFALGWRNNLLDLNGVRIPVYNALRNYQSALPEGIQSAIPSGQTLLLNDLPDYLLLQKGNTNLNLNSKVEAENKDFYLIKITRDLVSKPNIIGVSNPNGIDGDPYGPQYYWVGGDPTHIKIISPKEGELTLKMRVGLGPSLPDSSFRQALILNNSNGFSVNLKMSPETNQIPVRTIKGYNEILIRCLDQPQVKTQPNGDPRPLMFSISGLTLE